MQTNTFLEKKMSNMQKNFWEGENMSLHLRKRVPISHLLAFMPWAGVSFGCFQYACTVFLKAKAPKLPWLVTVPETWHLNTKPTPNIYINHRPATDVWFQSPGIWENKWGKFPIKLEHFTMFQIQHKCFIGVQNSWCGPLVWFCLYFLYHLNWRDSLKF